MQIYTRKIKRSCKKFSQVNLKKIYIYIYKKQAFLGFNNANGFPLRGPSYI